MRYTNLIILLLPATFTAALQKQKPLGSPSLGPAMPPDSPLSSTPGAANRDVVILSDVLGNDRTINIFAGFTRDFAQISQRFEDSTLNTTILAPINSAIMALPRKPWEDPKDYDALGTNAYEGPQGEERAHKNIERFVEEHVVPASPWKEGQKLKTLSGGEIWWENKNGVKLVNSLHSDIVRHS